jgi:tripartite-type tricarboxylate transporter receptor subunit TctC
VASVLFTGVLPVAVRGQGADKGAFDRYPDKPIRFVLPFTAGSGTDSSSRFVGNAITAATKQPVVVENKAGADGLVAAPIVARSAPDGYTVFITTMTTQSVNPHLYKKLPYDPVKDFLPVCRFTLSPMIMLVRAAEGQPRTFAEFAAHARSRQAPLNYATGNTSSRVAAEVYAHQVGIKVTRIPFRGTPEGLSELLAGRVDFMFVDLSPAMALVREGRLRGLAVTSSKRVAALPDLPTVAELNMPELQLSTWSAAFVPAGTPKAVIDKLSGLMQAALKSDEAGEYFRRNGVEPSPMTPEELASFVTSEYARWGQAVAISGIPPQ